MEGADDQGGHRLRGIEVEDEERVGKIYAGRHSWQAKLAGNSGSLFSVIARSFYFSSILRWTIGSWSSFRL